MDTVARLELCGVVRVLRGVRTYRMSRAGLDWRGQLGGTGAKRAPSDEKRVEVNRGRLRAGSTVPRGLRLRRRLHPVDAKFALAWRREICDDLC